MAAPQDSSTLPKDQPYLDRAELARSQPGVWVTLREGQSSANLVTRIRSAKVQDISESEFEVRSVKIGDRYDIEIRARVAEEMDLQKVLDGSVDRIVEQLVKMVSSDDAKAMIRQIVADEIERGSR